MATGTVAETAIDAVADAAEVVSEESGELAEATRLLSSRDAGLIIGGLGVGLCLGFAGGYWILNNRIKTKYDAMADEEIAKMREHYLRKEIALGERDEKGRGVDEVVRDLGYKSDPRGSDGGPVPYHKAGEKPDREPEEKDETRNVVEENRVEGDDILTLDPDWDYAKEIKSRDPLVPYVIHYDEYMEGSDHPEEYEKHTLTYFAGDDILCNERDQVIEDQDEIIGLGNLARFGHGSGDPNKVYIRNDEMKIDIVVHRSDGNYATEVHGFTDDEIRHSSMSRRLPRRSEYDDLDR